MDFAQIVDIALPVVYVLSPIYQTDYPLHPLYYR